MESGWKPVWNGSYFDVTIGDELSPTVAHVHVNTFLPGGDNRDTAAARARLISATPELLEAAKEFCRRVEAGEIRSKRSYASFSAAIAKAEGRS